MDTNLHFKGVLPNHPASGTLEKIKLKKYEMKTETITKQ